MTDKYTREEAIQMVMERFRCTHEEAEEKLVKAVREGRIRAYTKDGKQLPRPS